MWDKCWNTRPAIAHHRHPNKALTATAVRQLKTPGRYADGNGLYLVVDPSGARRWLLRTIVQGRRRDIGLGSARLVPLIDAREIAATMRRLARDGGDPVAERRKARTIVPTFKEAAEKVHAETVAAVLAFEFLILTACRTNEVLLASWAEVDCPTSTPVRQN